MKRHVSPAGRSGFTILELLVVVSIVVLLAALILPSTRNARGAARRTQCANNLKQIGLALHSYSDQHKTFPPAIIHSPDSSYTPRDFVLGTTGWVLLLPFLDKQTLYDQYDLAQGSVPGSIGPSEANRRITATRLSFFSCPEDGAVTQVTNISAPGVCVKAASANYLFAAGSRLNSLSRNGKLQFPFNEAAPSYGGIRELKSKTLGVFGHNDSARIADVKDGLANCIMAGETLQRHATGAPAAVVWGQGKLYGQMAVVDGLGSSQPGQPSASSSRTTINYPRTVRGQEQAAVDPAVLSSEHSNGANVLLADGAVRFITQTIDTDLYNRLFMIDDGLETPENF